MKTTRRGEFLLPRGQGASNFKHHHDARGVVVGPRVYGGHAAAQGTGAAHADVIVVRADDDRFFGQGAFAGQDGNHVAGFGLCALDIDASGGPPAGQLAALRLRALIDLLFQLGQIGVRRRLDDPVEHGAAAVQHGEIAARLPAAGVKGQHRVVVVLQLLGDRVDLPHEFVDAFALRFGLLPRGILHLLEVLVLAGQLVEGLVPPLAVGGERLEHFHLVGAEDNSGRLVFLGVGHFAREPGVGRVARAVERALRIVLLRLVTQEHYELAGHVDAGVVVVAFLRGRNAVAREDQRRVEVAHAAQRQRREILAQVDLDGLRFLALFGRRPGEHQLVVFRQFLCGGDGELLEGLAVEQVGLQARLGELGSDVIGRQADSLGLQAAAFEIVGSQIAGGVGNPLLDRGVFLGPQRCGQSQQDE